MNHVVVLCGGTGGAKLALGLSQTVSAGDLSIVVNTGDDFDHLGLRISPDLDTVVYTLANLSDQERGWGRESESWNFMSALSMLGGETWFNLGDKDLATHVLRTSMLTNGHSLTQATQHLCAKLGIGPNIIPMTDDNLRTVIVTDLGELSFQHYFVKHRCEPRAKSIKFENESTAVLSPGFNQLLQRNDIDCVIVCPSNPYLSIDPILSLPHVRDRLRSLNVPIIAVAPLIGGKAFKGPTSKLMIEFNVEPNAVSVARHYEGLITGLVIDHADDGYISQISQLGIHPFLTDITMETLGDRKRLARDVLNFARSLHDDKQVD